MVRASGVLLAVLGVLGCGRDGDYRVVTGGKVPQDRQQEQPHQTEPPAYPPIPLERTECGVWTRAGDMLAKRVYPSVSALRDGRVLVTGGWDENSNTVHASTELYDPITGAWTQAAPMQTARARHSAVVLEDGRVLVTGGSKPDPEGSVTLGTTEIYDPATGAWSQAAPMLQPRKHHWSVLLHDGRVLIVGGHTKDNPVRAAELYDPVADRWAAAGNTAEYPSGVVLLPSGEVMVAAVLEMAAPATLQLFDPRTNRWTAAPAPEAPRYESPTLGVLRGQVFLMGDQFEIFDLATATWSLGPWRGHDHVHGQPVTLRDQELVLVGGQSYPDASLMPNAYEVEHITGGGLQTLRMNFSRSVGHGAVAIGEDAVLTAGGWRNTAETYRRCD